MSIPAKHPRTMHLEPYHLNDSFKGIKIGFRRHYRFFDQDCNYDKEGNFWIKHWSLPRADGFTLIQRGPIRVKDPHPNKHISQRSSANVAKLRRPRSNERYRKASAHANKISKKGGFMCLEAKGGRGFNNVANWQRFKSELNPGTIVYVMTLQNIPGWRQRLRAAHEAGFEVALLPRGPKPADWHEFEGWVQVWGAFHKHK